MLRPNPEFVQELMHLVNTSPFPAHMAMRLISIEPDRAVLELEADRRHLQAYGIVHGGVLATLIDTATFWAVFLKIQEDAGLVNIDLKLNYLEPVVAGRLRAEGLAIRPGRSISYAEARVWDGAGRIVAHGTSTLMTLPGKGLSMTHPKFLSS